MHHRSVKSEGLRGALAAAVANFGFPSKYPASDSAAAAAAAPGELGKDVFLTALDDGVGDAGAPAAAGGGASPTTADGQPSDGQSPTTREGQGSGNDGSGGSPRTQQKVKPVAGTSL